LMAKTVLVIDDDPVICQVIENILYQSGYKVLTATSTFEGLVYLQRQQHVDLILLDIYFTDGFDGVTLVDRLVKHPYYCDIPVVMISRDSTQKLIDHSIGRGASGFISKPFTTESLLQQVEKVVGLN
ncbi:MAG: response regulator, partial [Dehalococcoidia bacterium]|nr:response regulator [Dehalococcoidia bacterium]